MAQTPAQKAACARYRERNREKRREYDRQRRAENPGLTKEHSRAFREKNPEYAAEWYKANREAIRLRRARWYADHREEHNERCREWNNGNVERRRAHCRNRRARVKGAGGSHSRDDIADIIRLQKRRCACCSTKLLRYEIDHIMPIARGGSNDRRNLQAVCPDCNRRKHAKDPVEFMREQGRLL